MSSHSEHSSNALLDAITEGIYELDASGTCTFCNATCVKLLGYDSKADLIGQNMRHDIQALNHDKSYQNTGVFLKKDGQNLPVRYTIYPKSLKNNTPGTTLIFSDISKLKQAQNKLQHDETHDRLTGLMNQRTLEAKIKSLLPRAKHHKASHILCLINLDFFKIVNDTCGHKAGDALLQHVSALLEKNMRKDDILARLKSDIFAIIVKDIDLKTTEKKIASLLKKISKQPFSWQEHTFNVSASVGVIPISSATKNDTELLKHAALACHIAKKKGRAQLHIYQGNTPETIKRQHEIKSITQINQSLISERFCLYAQSITPIDGSEDTHYELLLRMKSEQNEIILPANFLPTAERYNLMIAIDKWVISKAFSLLANNPDFYRTIGFCSINLSGQSLTEKNMQTFVINELIKNNIPPGKICFEITETATITNLDAAALFIRKMKVLGCRFALDDFGNGLSSFAYLKHLDVDYLKIDGLFISNIYDDMLNETIVRSIQKIARIMNIKTIAEFVENKYIMRKIKKIGVDYAQGYLIDKPQCFSDILARTNKVRRTPDV